jgi:hypothetical protein
MKIELKNVHVNERFSRETTCYTANIYVDGVKVGYVENDGNGGSDNIQYTDRAVEARVREYIKALPPRASHFDEDGERVETSGKPPFMMTMDEELFFGGLLDKIEEEKLRKRTAAKRQKFIDNARARGTVPFYAKLSDQSELFFEARNGSADQYAADFAKKRKVKVVEMGELR